ncbi:ABC transporter substrate-binding protein [Actinomadura darangshiensis]|uniref:ABC transporter substrate-binding protein n=1 Tax=Actinomadura darangshiensis TaxID=705336 RepID=A0A4V2YW79_9ACTN|nr:ABC transporter substrate-binding protein [Actinomadura darangshiensis]TDD84387.1 ABC transporter substrate-binding protein [Actinomadura darangshiensis]
MRNLSSPTGPTSRGPVRRRRPRVLAPAAALLLGSALLTACGDSSDSGGSTTVSIGSNGNIFSMSLELAQSGGYFEKRGVKVKLVQVTSSTGTAALQSGSIQFLNNSPNGFMSALAKKVPETAVALTGGGNPLGLVVSKKFADAHRLTAETPGEQVARALDGSKGGASSPNTKAESSLFLQKRGVDPTKVKWVSLPSASANKAALTSGQIDWFVTSEPIPLQIQNDGDGVVVVDPKKAPEWSAAQAGYGEFLVANKRYLADNGETTKKVVAAVQEATNYLGTHGADATVLNVARKAMSGIPDPVLKSSIELVEWPKAAAMDQAGWTKTAAFVHSLGEGSAETKVTKDDWTNQYVTEGGQS